MNKRLDAATKARIVVEAIRGDKTIAEISSQYEVNRKQISRWRNLLKEQLPNIFNNTESRVERDTKKLVNELYRQIGELKVENEWLKKKTELFEC